MGLESYILGTQKITGT